MMVMVRAIGGHGSARSHGQDADESENCQYESDPTVHLDQIFMRADRP
jgi:hypothetical protein